MAVSELRRLKIANVLYANIAGDFAAFCNPKNRGVNFTWEWFIAHSQEEAEWILRHSFNRVTSDDNVIAKTMAKEIAESLVRRLN